MIKMKFLILVALGLATATADESQVLKDFSYGNKQFTARVYQELQRSTAGNFLVCPLSVETVLALVHGGAGGRTAQQLSESLQLPQDPEQIQKIFRELTPLLQSTDYYTLSSANKVYVKKGSQIVDQFKSTAVDVFDAEIQNIDFEKSQEAAAKINEWVEKKTHDKIKDIVGSGDLGADTSAILINALYFHGKWAKPFDKDDTKRGAFYADGYEVEADMMELTDSFNFYESPELDAKFLELPYAGARDFISMTVVLPNDKNGLPALEARIADVFAAPRYQFNDVHVVLPKFKIESTTKFKPILQALGIEDAFEDYADFRGILADQALKIDQVIQKAFIEVEEKGTTASAATVVKLIPLSGTYRAPPPQQFMADHPFIFYIKIQDIVVFVGRHSSPTN